MAAIRKPTLGDRADLRIEIWPSAVSSYRQTRLQTTGVSLTPSEAREELEDVLAHSHVTYSSGEDMTVRAKLRRLGVDVQSDLTRVRSDHVRCTLAQVRKYDTSTRQGSRGGDATTQTRRVYDRDGGRMGFIRFGRHRPTADGIEYRPVAEENGGEAPPWLPLPEHIRAALRLPRNESTRALLEASGFQV